MTTKKEFKVNETPEKKFLLACHLAREGRSHREIARIVGIAKNTARLIQKNERECCREAGEEFGLKELPMRRGGYWDHKKHVGITA